MTFQEDGLDDNTPMSDSDLRHVVDDLRRELWLREIRLQELQSTPVREAVRRSISRRLATAATEQRLPAVARRGISRAARTVRPTASEIQRIASLYPFPRPQRPSASIVIPVHDQLDATLRCLESVFLASHGEDYEVIVVDDRSSEDTRRELRKIPRINLVLLDENLGYLRATNRGAMEARGDVLILLNNDTEVLDGWLGALLETLDDESIGAVGAKLLLPNHDIQEAGAIVWRDGTARHVGRGLDRFSARMGYARDVDYSSAACLAIRTDLWRKIGGFDERFVPAYYEDVDLCFAVRQLGYRVRYQPAAEVVHHEGTSHGHDESQGVKRFQSVNHEKFAEKWVDALGEQYAIGTDESTAMSRERFAFHAVVADHQIPRPHEDAGSLRMQTLLEEILRQGGRITFACPTDHVAPQDALALGRLGIDVATLDYTLSERLHDYGHDIDLAILSRPQICLQLLPDIRRFCPQASVVFDTVDLHHLREARRVPRTPSSELVSRAFLEIERAAIASTDTTIVVSDAEVTSARALCADARFVVLPTVNRIATDVAPAESRTGFMFLGGFAHPPNIDAAERLARSILPIVRASCPDAALWIVGSNAPPEIVALQSLPGIAHSGFVEDVDALMQEVRCLAAPLQWGAGVKGKITQSLAAGLPVVTTPIGAEGLGLVNGVNAFVSDDDEGLAHGIIRTLTDDELWRELSQAGQDLAREQFSPRRAADAVLALRSLGTR